VSKNKTTPIDDQQEEITVLSEGLQQAGWAGCMRWAAETKEITEYYTKETGKTMYQFRGGIEGMVDEATGYKEDSILSFLVWATETFWGTLEESPPAFQEAVKNGELTKCQN